MDFKMISENVSTFLKKQKQTILNNPQSINMVIRKLELYTDTFHGELQEMLRLEGRIVNASLLASFGPKPQLGEFNLNQLGEREKAKSKIYQLSLRLNQELQVYGPKMRAVFATHHTLEDFRNKVLILINKTINFPLQGTDLDFTIRGIRMEFHPEVWNWDRSLARLEKMFQQIGSTRVIENYLSKYGGLIQQSSDHIVKIYELYFSKCIEKYKSFYQGSEEALVPEAASASLAVGKTSEASSTAEEYIREIEREYDLEQTTRLEKITGEQQSEKNVTAVTITYSNNQQAVIRLSQLSAEEREELNRLLLRLPKLH
ncbi:hypothetical protein D3P08_06140 [Paenibacillus nanensis]|uniref:Uncharacterized protein n=1 Tax=Paenibacillus nanensis TaxID=393251 RepID=A0A3A1VMG0_9BACL|nr:hypothetical protein [Paenibacillus nanensis]RIX59703.1 hypothetical protein D3P08_06140 [Paenibacillus nanensis]